MPKQGVNEMKTELLKLAASLKLKLFADRPTIIEALAYATAIADLSGKNAPAVYSAIYVVLNTVAAQIEAIAKQPATAEVWTNVERSKYFSAAEKMQESGGGFAAAIADAYFRADSSNAAILRASFADLFAKYMEQ